MSAQLTIKMPVWLDFIFACPVLAFRFLRYGYTYRKIYLNDGLFTILDLMDYYHFAHFKWFVSGRRGKFYAARSFRQNKKNYKLFPLHREIMNAPKGRIVDHENGDSLDNRRANLRFATHAQNSSNRHKKPNTSSRYIGVAFEKRTKRWTATIKRNGKIYWGGRFDNEIDAAKARDKLAKKYHGKFARLNFSEP
jgi:hypothetical protein